MLSVELYSERIICDGTFGVFIFCAFCKREERNEKINEKTCFFVVMLLTVIIVSLFLFVGCQPTPEDPIIKSKGDGRLQSIIGNTAVPILSEPYSAPYSWIESLDTKNDKFLINIDASISVPNVTAYPVFRAYPEEITEESANTFITCFVGEAQLYKTINSRTKKTISDEIISIEDTINSTHALYLSGEMQKEEYDSVISFYKNQLAALKTEFKNAPTEKEATPIERKFVMIERFEDLFLYGIVGSVAETNSQISIFKDISEPYMYGQEKDYLIGTESVQFHRLRDKTDNLIGMTISYENALKLANDVVYNTMGYDNWGLARICSGHYVPTHLQNSNAWTDYVTVQGKSWYDLPEAYVFIYTPNVGDCPMLYYNSEYQNSYGREWHQNCLYVVVKDSGVCRVHEESSLKIGEQLNSNVPLLSFDEVKDIFSKYIVMNADFSSLDGNAENKPICQTINITDIRLGYVRIFEKNSLDTGLLIPVWMFFGTQIDTFSGQESAPKPLNERNEVVYDEDVANAFLCINAIDGSIIDLSQGY